MTRGTGPYRPPYFTLDYTLMGLMTIDEFRQAILTDLHVLKETYNIKYLKGSMLKLSLTDKFGEHAPLKNRSNGKAIYRMHTHYYRPACLDYDP